MQVEDVFDILLPTNPANQKRHPIRSHQNQTRDDNNRHQSEHDAEIGWFLKRIQTVFPDHVVRVPCLISPSVNSQAAGINCLISRVAIS